MNSYNYYKQIYSVPIFSKLLNRLQKKSKRGLSSILGTVIVLAITIALGGLLYAYSNGMFGNMTQNANVNAQAQLIVNPSTNQAYLQFSLQNNGNLQVQITSITVNGQTLSTSIQLNPGDSYQNVTSLSGTFTPGSYYTVIFSGKTATGKPFSSVQNILASNTG